MGGWVGVAGEGRGSVCTKCFACVVWSLFCLLPFDLPKEILVETLPREKGRFLFFDWGSTARQTRRWIDGCGLIGGCALMGG